MIGCPAICIQRHLFDGHGYIEQHPSGRWQRWQRGNAAEAQQDFDTTKFDYSHELIPTRATFQKPFKTATPN